jgi:tRNA (adenine22-N1)-methyltransferase
VNEPAGRRLPPRLAAVAAAVTLGSRVADVGTDHGRLPLWLARTGSAAFCLATEKNAALLARVARPPGDAPWSERLGYRAGDGLAAVRPSDRIDTVILSGLGAGTILRILEAPGARRLALRRLIVQPRTDEALVRGWLSDHGWCPVSERLTAERGRLHVTIAAERGDDDAVYRHPALDRNDLLAAGPLLVSSRPPELASAWRAQVERLEAIARRGGSGAAMARAERELERARRIVAAISTRGG